jgi:hypothetical protein
MIYSFRNYIQRNVWLNYVDLLMLKTWWILRAGTSLRGQRISGHYPSSGDLSIENHNLVISLLNNLEKTPQIATFNKTKGLLRPSLVHILIF